jgi:putative ABC transport system substrate-binding protein
MPVIGFLSSRSSEESANVVASFRQGLSEDGYVEGRNIEIQFRWADGHYDRLPGLAAELVGRKVAVIVATGGPAPALAAKAATTAIPIVFVSGGDPVRAGLVASLNRPGGNITGVSSILSTLMAKRLQLLHQLVPKAAVIGVLVNPGYPDSDLQLRELQEAGAAIKLQILVMRAGTEGDIDTAFATLAQQRIEALLVANDPFFDSRRQQINALAARHAIAVICPGREFVDAGGLISYGPSLADVYRLAGNYTGKVLKGAKPADLPVQQPTKFELVINLKTAKMLGLEVPQLILAGADEVVE